ncbi:predicted protein [Histoplasma capsulatum G186AR]|uniref:Uncharacterized protein n=1 Tax=Ajellomyces capsulatus (strain G186AR / H82 / ATCC MYA-2454 / RMSCC 2432) TaxID=447093 RepID=C0NB24_AJECG|nr:uncharacterized protein HCBG_00320 [Histoplasma capsulatum G186AR]EEH10865.1 predicted protein [Histoplasma capsulatum G186AR]
MQAMEAVVVPAPGAWVHDEEKEVEKEVEGVEEEDMGILGGWSSGGSVGESAGGLLGVCMFNHYGRVSDFDSRCRNCLESLLEGGFPACRRQVESRGSYFKRYF